MTDLSQVIDEVSSSKSDYSGTLTTSVGQLFSKVPHVPVDDEDRGDLETEEEAEVTRLNESEDEIVKPTPFINQN